MFTQTISYICKEIFKCTELIFCAQLEHPLFCDLTVSTIKFLVTADDATITNADLRVLHQWYRLISRIIFFLPFPSFHDDDRGLVGRFETYAMPDTLFDFQEFLWTRTFTTGSLQGGWIYSFTPIRWGNHGRTGCTTTAQHVKTIFHRLGPVQTTVMQTSLRSHSGDVVRFRLFIFLTS